MPSNLPPGVYDSDPHFQDSPLATFAQIREAIIMRHIQNNNDIYNTAEQLAAILDPLGIDLGDIREGIPAWKFRDNE